MQKFHEALREARGLSNYRSAADFAQASGIPESTYRCYENGSRLPSKESLDYIVSRACVPPAIKEKLYALYRLSQAEVHGIDLEMFRSPVNVSDLAEKIAREVKFELHRYGINVTPRIERVCTRRITMILDDALRKE